MIDFIKFLNNYKSIEREELLSCHEGLRDVLTDISIRSIEELSSVLSNYSPDITKRVIEYKRLDSLILRSLAERIKKAFRIHIWTYVRVLRNDLKQLFPDASSETIFYTANKILKSFMKICRSGDKVLCKKEEVKNIVIQGREIICVTDNTNRKERKIIVSIGILEPVIKGGTKFCHFSADISFSWNNKNISEINNDLCLLKTREGITKMEMDLEVNGAEVQKSLAQKRSDLICEAPELLIKNNKTIIFKQIRYGNFLKVIRIKNYKWLLAELLRVIHGIRFINEMGYVHRDIKPENLFVSKEDRVLIGDFGLVAADYCAPAGSAYSISQVCFHNEILKMFEEIDAFAFVINLAIILFGDALNEFLKDPAEELDDKKYLLEIVNARRSFAEKVSYEDINNLVYQNLLMYTLTNKLKCYLTSNMHCGYELINKISRLNSISDLIDEISRNRIIPDNLKPECFVMIRLYEAAFKLLVDAVKYDVENEYINSEKILEELLAIPT